MAGGLLGLLGLLVAVCLQTALCQRVCDWNTCRECIRDPNLCMWCATETNNTTNNILDGARCKPISYKVKDWCPKADIQSPEGNSTVTESKDFSSEVGNIVQIKPKRYTIDLRVGQEQRFTFSYKASENFPVDVYFLLDASKSMQSIKDDLHNQTYTIFQTMRNLTTDVFMGLGTFIDKNMVPFTNNVKAHTSYSFKHRLSLTSDIKSFETALGNIKFEDNSDNPEAGLEGIAQAIACKPEINWRNQSRKILVYMTDDGYHSAGDGKAAGLVTPYDGGCYLNDDGYYTKEKEFDYPSVSIINYMATKEQIKILFVAKTRHDTIYSTLASAISESEMTKYHPRAIVRVLEDTYKRITKDVQLKVNLTAAEREYFEISFDPKCDLVRAPNCDVTPGEEKTFTGKILLKKYFNKDHFSIGINPKGLKEKIVLDVNVLSDCGCSKDLEVDSEHCHKIGNWSCGVCECPDAKFGSNCECTGNSSHCSPPDSTIRCSGHGDCNSCGNCDCHDGYKGTYCEDQTNNCPRDDARVLCSGNGNCLNKICTCLPGWEGIACECTTSNKACIHDGVVCNNRGDCECGACKCFTPEKWDARVYDKFHFCAQSHCYDCNSQQCRHLIPCVDCLYDGKPCVDKCGHNLIHLHDTSASGVVDESKWQNCTQIQVAYGCYFDFKYIYNDNNTLTLVELKKNCSQSQILIGIISVVILVAIGLATLIAWKLLTNARDRREYEAFLKSSQGGDSIRINPTYTAPSTTYHNPAFQSS